MNAISQVFDYFEHDNAKFRRLARKGGVDDVLHGDVWKPYTGTKIDPALYGDKIDDPLSGATMSKSIDAPVMFRKAIIPGGASGDLFGGVSKTHVKAHTTSKGVMVKEHDRKVAHRHTDEPSPAAKHFYVSAINGARRHLVAGPYGSHDEAKSRVDDVFKHADASDPRAHFMAWGTAGTETPVKTPLGENWQPASDGGSAHKKLLTQPQKGGDIPPRNGDGPGGTDGDRPMANFVSNPTTIRTHPKFTMVQVGNSMKVNGETRPFYGAAEIAANAKHFVRNVYPELTGKMERGEIAGFVVAPIDGKEAQIIVTHEQYACGADERSRFAAWQADCATAERTRKTSERRFDALHNEGGEGYNPYRQASVRTYR